MANPVSLHSAGHRRGAVCAPHFATVETGASILAEGGNAIEAMLAMAGSIAAVYPHMNHLGGDGFWIIREPSRRGRAPIGGGAPGPKAPPPPFPPLSEHTPPPRPPAPPPSPRPA